MKGWTTSLVAGILAMLAGIIALLFPLPAGLAVTTFAGAAFLVFGAMGLFGAWSDASLARRGFVAFAALLQLVLGVAILANPLMGLITLTLLTGVLFLMSGLWRLMLAWQMRGRQQAPVMLLALSGLLSLGLGFYVFFAPGAASEVLLGTLLAVELLSAGAALIALAFALRKMTDTPHG